MSNPSNQVIATYSELAQKYDDPSHVTSWWTSHSDRIVASLDIKSSFDTVAEVGCGTGRALFHVASRSSPTVRFIGVEPAQQMRQRAAAVTRDLPNVRIVEGTFERLPLERASVDYMFSIDAFHWTPDAPAAVNEIARVMRPSGEMDLFFNGGKIGREFIQVTTPIYVRYMGLRYIVEAARTRHRFTKDQALALFSERFGTDRVQVDEVHRTYYDTVEGHLDCWVRFEPQMLPQLLALPAERRSECQRKIREALATLATDKGVPYTMHQLHVQVR